MVTWIRLQGYLTYVTPELAARLIDAGLADYAYPNARRPVATW